MQPGGSMPWDQTSNWISECSSNYTPWPWGVLKSQRDSRQQTAKERSYETQETTGAQKSVWWGAEWLVLNQKKNDGGESTFSDNSELRATDGSTEGLDAGQYRQLVTDVQFLPKSSRQNMDACILSPFSILLICLLTIRVKLTIIPQLMPKPR